jgi:hypothetical protein
LSAQAIGRVAGPTEAAASGQALEHTLALVRQRVAKALGWLGVAERGGAAAVLALSGFAALAHATLGSSPVLAWSASAAVLLVAQWGLVPAALAIRRAAVRIAHAGGVRVVAPAALDALAEADVACFDTRALGTGRAEHALDLARAVSGLARRGVGARPVAAASSVETALAVRDLQIDGKQVLVVCGDERVGADHPADVVAAVTSAAGPPSGRVDVALGGVDGVCSLPGLVDLARSARRLDRAVTCVGILATLVLAPLAAVGALTPVATAVVGPVVALVGLAASLALPRRRRR